MKIAPPLEGLDLNRNWPADWAPEGEQLGAGPYPTSEPEVRALVQAIVERPNITNYIGYHTFAGVHLRPYSGRADDDFPTTDLRAFKLMGEEATRLTGYPSISIFHDFKYDPKMVIRGGDIDWVYDFLGAFAWVTEFWSPQRAAGLEDYHFIDWIRDHPPEDDLAMLKLADELGEDGYVDWYEFDHPQLGQVELGGWNLVYFWFNAPLLAARGGGAAARRLRACSSRSSRRGSRCARSSRRPVGDGAYRLRLVLENSGWLPTNVTQKALDRKAVRPIEVEPRAAGGGARRGGSGARGSGPARRARRAAGGDVVERRPLDERAHEGRVGGRGGGGVPSRGGRAARARGGGARRAHALRAATALAHVHVFGLALEELGQRLRGPARIRDRGRSARCSRTAWRETTSSMSPASRAMPSRSS